jgi:hypothetical protein
LHHRIRDSYPESYGELPSALLLFPKIIVILIPTTNDRIINSLVLIYHQHCCDDEAVPIKVLMNPYFSLLKLLKT